MESMKEFFPFHYDTGRKLREIFTEHCNLSMEEYEEISGQFLYLVCDIQDGEPQAEIEKRMDYMRAVFEFLYNTKQTTMEEQYELSELLDDVWDKAVKMKVELANLKEKVAAG